MTSMERAELRPRHARAGQRHRGVDGGGAAKSEFRHRQIARKEGLPDHERNPAWKIGPVRNEADENEDGKRRRWNSCAVPRPHRSQKDTDTRLTGHPLLGEDIP